MVTNEGQIKAILASHGVIKVSDFEKIHIDDTENGIKIIGVKINIEKITEAERQLEKKIIF